MSRIIPADWKILIKDSDGRTYLFLTAPNGSSVGLSIKRDNDNGQNIGSQVLHWFRDALSAPAPSIDAEAVRKAASPIIDELAERFSEKPGSVDDYADYMGRIPDAIVAALRAPDTAARMEAEQEGQR